MNGRFNLNVLEKEKILNLTEPELRPLGRPARTQSLYQQRYPSSPLILYQSGKQSAEELHLQ
jgi:hypothetical protein